MEHDTHPMDSNLTINGHAPEKIDLSMHAVHDSTKVVEKPDAGLRSQEHCTRIVNWSSGAFNENTC